MNQTTQNFANHRRLHPPFHFFVSPLALFTAVFAFVNAIAYNGRYTHWVVAMMSLSYVGAVILLRTNGLKVQDRIIRLEVALRYERLAGKSLESVAPDLTNSQLVALRFASDAELVGLAERAAKEKLKSSDIKRSIQSWRADYHRL